jgi:hypothetical protein
MACIYELKLAGIKTNVLPGPFLIHMGYKGTYRWSGEIVRYLKKVHTSMC